MMSLGPFAPIRSQDADVVFDVLDMRPNMNQASIGTVRWVKDPSPPPTFLPSVSTHTNLVYTLRTYPVPFVPPPPPLPPPSISSMRLRDLQDQEQKDVVKFLKLREASGELKLSQSGLYLTIHFQYSKVAPIRAKIYTVQVI